MRTNTRGIMTGGLIGLLVAGTLALPSALPPAMANDEPARTLLKTMDEIFPKPLEASMFAKPEWTVEPWVSEEVLSTTVVRKVGYGRTTFVSIMKTPTGTYSTDGIASPNIRYPGIVKNSEASSFLTIVPFKGGRMIVGPSGSCVRVKYGTYC